MGRRLFGEGICMYVNDQISRFSRLWMCYCSDCGLQRNDSMPFSSLQNTIVQSPWPYRINQFILPPCRACVVTPARYPFDRCIAKESERSHRLQSSSCSSSSCSSLQPLVLMESVLFHHRRRTAVVRGRSLVSSTRCLGRRALTTFGACVAL